MRVLGRVMQHSTNDRRQTKRPAAMKSRILAITMLAMCGAPAPAFAQAHVLEGNILPMDYDGEGGRHYLMYGYYGDHMPDMPSHKKGMSRHVSRSKHHAAPREANGH
jgi:hypothetical protein